MPSRATCVPKEGSSPPTPAVLSLSPALFIMNELDEREKSTLLFSVSTNNKNRLDKSGEDEK